MSNPENRPPCPGSPGEFVWVRSASGGHWRRKRGTFKKAVLNHVLSTNARLTKYTNDAASRLMNHLRPYLNGVHPGRSYVQIAGRLKQAYKANGAFDFSRLLDFDFQKNCPIKELLKLNANITEVNEQVELVIPVSRAILKHETHHVSHLRFQLILVHGNLSNEQELYDHSVESDLIDVSGQEHRCSLTMQLPQDHPWMLLLHITCISGELSEQTQKHGIRVIRVGGTAPKAQPHIGLD